LKIKKQELGVKNMAHFAEINSSNNIVLRVIVVGEDKEQQYGYNTPELEQWVSSFHPKNDPDVLQEYNGIYPNTYWKQTSYNTFGGQHLKGGIPLRKNFAGRGCTYDSQKDAFIAPKPYSSWLLNEDTCRWEAPVAIPSIQTYGDNIYYVSKWDEQNVRWLGYTREENPQEFAWNPSSQSWIATGN
jgi:hypothetical protein